MKDITLFKFQNIQAINATEMSDIDKVLFSVCAVFDLTEYQLDNMLRRKVNRLIKKTVAIFKQSFTNKPLKRIGKYIVNYDISKLTFGQYIELSFFFSKDKDPVINAHYAMASVTRLGFKKYKTTDHKVRAEYFLTRPVIDIVGSLALLIKNYNEFNAEYKSLFTLDPDIHGEMIYDLFNKRYGWVFSAGEVAKYENITLDQAYGLPIRQALNDLNYLKEKSKYDDKLLKKK